MRSFDLFDTLLFRVCGEPENIFKIMSKTIGHDDFYIQRKSTHGKTLDEIYQKLSSFFHWTPSQKNEYMEMERNLEKKNLYPIQKNVQQLQEKDIIVSDMYLEHSFLREILDHWNITNKLFVTPEGKSKNTIWKTLKEEGYPIKQHFGNDLTSDVRLPRFHGIQTIHLQDHLFTKEEKLWEPEVATCFRYMRLTSVRHDPFYQWIFQCQTQMNIPHLLFYCTKIIEIIKEKNISKILFSLRDCHHLYKIFSNLYPEYESDFLYCSRLMYSKPNNPFYKNYFVSKLAKNNQLTLIVDLHGSGKSIYHYLSHHNLMNLVHVSYHIRNNHHCSFPPEFNFHAVYKDFDIKISERIEIMNYMSCGSLIDFDDQGPLFSIMEYPLYYSDCIEMIIQQFCEYVKTFSIPKKHYPILNFDRPWMKKLSSIHQNNHEKKKIKVRKNDFKIFYSKVLSPLEIYILHQKHQVKRKESMMNLLKDLRLKNSTLHWITPHVTPNGKDVVNKNEYSHLMSFLSILEHHPQEKALLFMEDDIKPLYPVSFIQHVMDVFHEQMCYQNHVLKIDIIIYETCFAPLETSHKVLNRLKNAYCTACLYIPPLKSQKVLHCLKELMKKKVYATDELLSRLIRSKKLDVFIHLPLFIQDLQTFGTSIHSKNHQPTRNHQIRCKWQSFVLQNDTINSHSLSYQSILLLICICIVVILVILSIFRLF